MDHRLIPRYVDALDLECSGSLGPRGLAACREELLGKDSAALSAPYRVSTRLTNKRFLDRIIHIPLILLRDVARMGL